MYVLYDQNDLVDFANYILSDERDQKIALQYDPNDGVLFDKFKKSITSSDLETWHLKKQIKQ
jgi:hypothetical protein